MYIRGLIPWDFAELADAVSIDKTCAILRTSSGSVTVSVWNVMVCFMTGENPVSWLTQFVFINMYVYLKTGLNWPIG